MLGKEAPTLQRSLASLCNTGLGRWGVDSGSVAYSLGDSERVTLPLSASLSSFRKQRYLLPGGPALRVTITVNTRHSEWALVYISEQIKRG